LLNGVVVAGVGGLTSTIANWAQFGANSTITYATGGGTGGSIVMCNGYFSNTSTTGTTTQALTVSTINGQTVAGLGQTIAYRPVSLLSSQTFNSGTTPTILLTGFSNAVGKSVAGSLNMTLGGYAGISNSGSTIPYMGIFVTDNNVAPYLPTSALGGTQIADWYLFGPNTNPGTGAGTVPPTDVSLSYAFSNAGSQLMSHFHTIFQKVTILSIKINKLGSVRIMTVCYLCLGGDWKAGTNGWACSSCRCHVTSSVTGHDSPGAHTSQSVRCQHQLPVTTQYLCGHQQSAGIV
jgi:hypothetical protein